MGHFCNESLWKTGTDGGSCFHRTGRCSARRRTASWLHFLLHDKSGASIAETTGTSRRHCDTCRVADPSPAPCPTGNCHGVGKGSSRRRIDRQTDRGRETACLPSNDWLTVLPARRRRTRAKRKRGSVERTACPSSLCRQVPLFISGCYVIIQQLFNQINMCKKHATATIPLQPQLGKCLALGLSAGDERHIRVPFVSNNLAAGETANRNDHGKTQSSMSKQGAEAKGDGCEKCLRQKTFCPPRLSL